MLILSLASIKVSIENRSNACFNAHPSVKTSIILTVLFRLTFIVYSSADNLDTIIDVR